MIEYNNFHRGSVKAVKHEYEVSKKMFYVSAVFSRDLYVSLSNGEDVESCGEERTPCKHLEYIKVK